MNRRYDIKSPRPRKDGKTFWFKVGTLFVDPDKDEYSILLDALPIPDEKGRVALKAYPPREAPAGFQEPHQRPIGGSGTMADEDGIPF